MGHPAPARKVGTQAAAVGATADLSAPQRVEPGRGGRSHRGPVNPPEGGARPGHPTAEADGLYLRSWTAKRLRT